MYSYRKYNHKQAFVVEIIVTCDDLLGPRGHLNYRPLGRGKFTFVNKFIFTCSFRRFILSFTYGIVPDYYSLHDPKSAGRQGCSLDNATWLGAREERGQIFSDV